jgi:hypothetical protein
MNLRVVLPGPPGPPGSPVYETRAAAAATFIQLSQQFISTAGYSTPGDLGRAFYKRGTALTTGGFQSADGAFWDLAEPIIRPMMFGARGDYAGNENTATNDTAAIQAMLDFCRGHEIDWLNRRYLIGKTSGTEVLLWQYPARFRGRAGRNSSIAPGSVLIVKSNTPTTIDIMRLAPHSSLSGEDLFGWVMAHLRLCPHSGEPGRHGFFIDLPGAAQYFLAKFEFEGNWIGRFSGSAFRQNKGAEADDGFFTSVVKKNRFDGGTNCDYCVGLIRSGDSLTLEDNTCAGGGIGIYTEPVEGAARQTFEENNITATGGAFYAKDAQQINFDKNQCEQSAAYTGSDDAQIVLDNCGAIELNYNNMNAHGRVSNVRLKAGTTRVGGVKNTMRITSASGKAHFVRDAGALGDNDFPWRENDFIVDEIRRYRPVVADSSGAMDIFRKYVRRTPLGDANAAISATDEVVELTQALTAARTWNLPAAADVPPGKSIVINDATLGAVGVVNTLTIARQVGSGDLINGATSWTINSPRRIMTFVSNGSNRWAIEPRDIGYAAFGDADFTLSPQLSRTAALVASLTAPRTWTLPAAADFPTGVPLTIIDRVGGISATNTLTIQRAGSDLIDGVASLWVINTPRSVTKFYSDGATGWFTHPKANRYTALVDADATLSELSNQTVALTAALTAPRTWTLPAANKFPGGVPLTIIDLAGGVTPTNTLTLARQGTDVINGATSFVLNATRGMVTLFSNGISSWFAIKSVQ